MRRMHLLLLFGTLFFAVVLGRSVISNEPLPSSLSGFLLLYVAVVLGISVIWTSGLLARKKVNASKKAVSTVPSTLMECSYQEPVFRLHDSSIPIFDEEKKVIAISTVFYTSTKEKWLGLAGFSKTELVRVDSKNSIKRFKRDVLDASAPWRLSWTLLDGDEREVGRLRIPKTKPKDVKYNLVLHAAVGSERYQVLSYQLHSTIKIVKENSDEVVFEGDFSRFAFNKNSFDTGRGRVHRLKRLQKEAIDFDTATCIYQQAFLLIVN